MRLNENVGYISQPKTQMLMEKIYKDKLAVLENVSGGKFNMERKAAIATTMDNMAQALRFMESTGATQSSDIGQFKRFAVDMTGAVVSNILAPELVSVQAMDNRIGMVNFMKYHYGTTKGATKAGTVFGDTRNLYQSDKNYTSDVAENEPLNEGTAATAFEGVLDWTPVVPGSVTIVAGDVVVKDNGSGVLTASAGLAGDGTINYATGEYKFTLVKESTAVATYSYNNEVVPAKNIPSLTLSIESLPIKAKTRRLSAIWGFEASYELQKEYGQNIEDLLTTTATSEITHEIDIEVMDNLYALAALNNDLSFNTTAPQAISLQDHYDSFLININKGANKIYQDTRRVRPNYIVCGTDVASVIQAIRTFQPSNETNTKGPYFAGKLGPYKVYVSPDYDPKAFVLGYKGDTLLDAGYIYAPYMPVTSTAMVQLEDMAGRKGFATMYGTRAVNDRMYSKGRII